MTLLLLILFISTLIFLFYYELMWKKPESNLGRSFVSVANNFLFRNPLAPRAAKVRLERKEISQTNWGDWKYRLMVELHRRDQLGAKDAADLLGVSEDRIERHMDKLEGEGKIKQVGDADRGIFYKAVSGEV